MTIQDDGEICEICGEATRGGFENYERVAKDGTPVFVIDSTPDRAFNVCDLCNKVVHFRCSMHPETGYCDACLEKVYPDGVREVEITS